MKLLLDTQLLLWAAATPQRLTLETRTLLDAPDHELVFSAASLWEIVIKSALGRDDFRVDARLLRRGLLDNGYTELPIGSNHALTVAALPALHKDPFDRMLIAQAIEEGVTLLTADRTVAAYGAPARLI